MSGGAETLAKDPLVDRLNLRGADAGDAETVWRLRNHSETRGWFVNDRPIPLDDHRRWYADGLASGSDVIYLGEVADSHIGYVRFDAAGGKTPDVSFVVDPAWRGRGFGGRMLSLACRRFFDEYPEADRIHTSIEKRNSGSYLAFRRCCFVETEDDENYYYTATRDVFGD